MSAKTDGPKGPSEKPAVWWTNPRSLGGRQGQIVPYLDAPYTGMDMLHSMGELNDILRLMNAPVPKDRRPTDLRWKLRKVTDKERNLPDAIKIIMAAIMVSEAFRDVAAGFDLGESQFIEVPLYEAKSVDMMGNVELDPDRRDPRRWFLFHILPRKTALLTEASSGIHCFNKKWGWWAPVTGGANDKNDIVLDAAAALSGTDIWRDETIPDLVFFSDRLKRAIKSAKLRTPAFTFKPCRTA
jgi:hypothetical protein